MNKYLSDFFIFIAHLLSKSSCFTVRYNVVHVCPCSFFTSFHLRVTGTSGLVRFLPISGGDHLTVFSVVAYHQVSVNVEHYIDL